MQTRGKSGTKHGHKGDTSKPNQGVYANSKTCWAERIGQLGEQGKEAKSAVSGTEENAAKMVMWNDGDAFGHSNIPV